MAFKGTDEFKAKGLAEAREIARLLKEAGDPLEKISTITGLSISNIEKL
ncbi:hypothetical protein ACFLRT_00735 [Acidobacteriota bacterium]